MLGAAEALVEAGPDLVGAFLAAPGLGYTAAAADPDRTVDLLSRVTQSQAARPRR